jgi:hypothetical protein
MMEEMAVEAHQFRMTEAQLKRDAEWFNAMATIADKDHRSE